MTGKKLGITLLIALLLAGIIVTMADTGFVRLADKKIAQQAVTTPLVRADTSALNASLMTDKTISAVKISNYSAFYPGKNQEKANKIFPHPGPEPGGDLTILDVKEYRYVNDANNDGNHDIYRIDFVVKNIGGIKTGESNIAYSDTRICEGGGVESGIIQPQVTVSPLEPKQKIHMSVTMTETPGCSEGLQGIMINCPLTGCFGPDDEDCVQVSETDYANNFWEGSYTMPDKSLPYSPKSPTNKQVADAVYAGINDAREQYGNNLKPLARNMELDKIAQGFSDSMASTLTYPEDPPHNAGGNNWGGVGGRQETMLKKGLFNPAENIMKASPDNTGFGCDGVSTTVEDTAESLAEYTILSWVVHDACKGNGHRNTLLSDPSSYGGSIFNLPTEIGVGAAKGTDGYYYITADFAHT